MPRSVPPAGCTGAAAWTCRPRTGPTTTVVRSAGSVDRHPGEDRGCRPAAHDLDVLEREQTVARRGPCAHRWIRNRTRMWVWYSLISSSLTTAEVSSTSKPSTSRRVRDGLLECLVGRVTPRLRGHADEVDGLDHGHAMYSGRRRGQAYEATPTSRAKPQRRLWSVLAAARLGSSLRSIAAVDPRSRGPPCPSQRPTSTTRC